MGLDYRKIIFGIAMIALGVWTIVRAMQGGCIWR